MSRTIQQLMTEAIQVQNACNLSGVVYSFANVITDLRANGVTDTDAIRHHPVSVLFSSKIASLTNSDDAHTFSVAYGACADGMEELNKQVS